uniref:Uncharacterized protein n=1 Tax=Cajanus cajan TaxID=3821 RepID=A0A151U9U3_CAJCA|nr:hypothetical protein KK1_020299 [Cajanus cajan]
MLQWMGGSRRKVTASRKSMQKRQKQYFEQRKRQQQNPQMVGSDNCFDSLGISGQDLKEHRSLDILNLLNLSKNAQQCNPFCAKGRDDGEVCISTMPGSVSTNQPTMFTNLDTTTVNCCRVEEAKVEAPLCCQTETSPNKRAPDHQNTAFSGPQNHWKTVTDEYSELSVLDLLCDDESNATTEKFPTCEDHVSFSLEGLGKVGIETPVHSPEHRARIPYKYSPLQKDGRKSKLKKLNHVLDDIELEVDTMMQDIEVSPISSSDFPFNKVRRSSAIVGNGKHFYDFPNKNGLSVSEEFFYKTENSDEDLWNACSGFLDEKFGNEMGYDASGKKGFQMGSKSPELLKSGAYKMDNYAFEDLHPKKWSSATAMKEIDRSEPLSSFSKDELESDFDFYVAGRARLDGKFNTQNLIPEDVRDNSSLLSEESSSTAAVRSETTAHSPSRILTGENRRKHRNAFVSPRKHRNAFASPRNKCSTKDEKCKSLPNSSKRIPSYYPNSILREELGTRDWWQFEEKKNASVDNSSVADPFRLDLEADFAVFRSNNRIEDPFGVFTTPEFRNNASPSFSGLKNDAPLADSPPCGFTSEKFAFDCSTAFPNVPSWPTSPSLSPDLPFKGKSEEAAGGFHCDTSSTDMSGQGSVSKGERQVKLQKDTLKNFDQDIFMGDNELSSEKNPTQDGPSSKNHAQECEDTEDTNPKATECLVTADSSGHVEDISSLLKKPDKQESQIDKIKSNCDAEAPPKCKIANEEKKFWLPEGRNTTSGKHNNDKIRLSGEMMFESYVFQILRVQKVLK